MSQTTGSIGRSFASVKCGKALGGLTPGMLPRQSMPASVGAGRRKTLNCPASSLIQVLKVSSITMPENVPSMGSPTAPLRVI
jgi:hypothetical protein